MGAREDAEENLVREVGDAIGYGRTMQLCEQLWRKYLVARNYPPGGELTTGPCAALMVPCPCPESGRDRNGHCDWCCGCGRITKRVLQAMDLESEHGPQLAYEQNVSAYPLDQVEDITSIALGQSLDIRLNEDMVAIIDAEMELVALVPIREVTSESPPLMLHHVLVRILNEAK